MANIPGLPADVFFGDKPLPNWRHRLKTDQDDDRGATPEERRSVKRILGFDPREFDVPATRGSKKPFEKYAADPCGDTKGGFQKGNTCSTSESSKLDSDNQKEVTHHEEFHSFDRSSDIHEWGKKHYSEWADGLGDIERSAIKDYTEGNYAE